MLRFHEGGFKVMQVTDIQDAGTLAQGTVRLIAAALEREKPDLAVLTGDQLAGYSPKLKGSAGAARAYETIRRICALFEQAGVPFTVCFGNHDVQAVPAARQLAWYRENPLCLAEDTPGVSGCGNHALEIAGAHGRPKLCVYCLDSHGGAGGGYEPLQPDQIDWYRARREELRARAGDYVPSVLFQHIPVEETYRLLRPARKGEKGVRGFRGRRKTRFALDESKALPGSRLLEAICAPDTDAGLFAAAREKGEMAAMFFGHDHKNSFAGPVDGVTLGYCPGCGYATYGDGARRGVRVFEFSEANPREFQTRLLLAEELPGCKKTPLKTRLLDRTPSSADDALAKLPKLLAALALLAALIVLLAKLL